jgi:hypothetical protein
MTFLDHGGMCCVPYNGFKIHLPTMNLHLCSLPWTSAGLCISYRKYSPIALSHILSTASTQTVTRPCEHPKKSSFSSAVTQVGTVFPCMLCVSGGIRTIIMTKPPSLSQRPK